MPCRGYRRGGERRTVRPPEDSIRPNRTEVSGIEKKHERRHRRSDDAFLPRQPCLPMPAIRASVARLNRFRGNGITLQGPAASPARPPHTGRLARCIVGPDPRGRLRPSSHNTRAVPEPVGIAVSRFGQPAGLLVKSFDEKHLKQGDNPVPAPGRSPDAALRRDFRRVFAAANRGVHCILRGRTPAADPASGRT